MAREPKDFFAAIGEIWRDMTAIEFLMRCAIAQKEGDIKKLPKPPYVKGNTYKEFPRSFAEQSFSKVVSEFSEHFPEFSNLNAIVDFRHALAHGAMTKIDHSEVEELFKFKLQKESGLVVEFNLPLDQPRLDQIRQSMKEMRQHISKVAADENWQMPDKLS